MPHRQDVYVELRCCSGAKKVGVAVHKYPKAPHSKGQSTVLLIYDCQGLVRHNPERSLWLLEHTLYY